MGQEERDNHQEKETEQIKEMGALELGTDRQKHRIQLLTIIGEIEGHEAVSGNTKATKYEHLLPKLAEIEDSEEIEGVLILLNTMGGDVEAGLAIAEMIASLSKPTVSLVLGGSHSIGGSSCRIGRLFFYCAKRDDDRASGARNRNVYWCTAEL